MTTTAVIRTYNTVIVENSGLRSSFPETGLELPVGEASFDFASVTRIRALVRTENSLPIFATSVGDRYQYATFRIIGAGDVIVSSKVDKPTNAAIDNWVPLGTQIRWQHEYWTCKMGCWVSNSDLVPGLDVAATEQGDTAGAPTLWSSSFFTKKRYRIDLYNPSETTDVEVEYLVVGKL